MEPLAYRQSGIRETGLNARDVRKALEKLAVPGLPLGTFGIAGGAARERHNQACDEFNSRARRGVESAEGISRNLKLTADGYVRASNDVMRAVLAVGRDRQPLVRGEAPSPESEVRNGLGYGLTSLGTTGVTLIRLAEASSYLQRGSAAGVANLSAEAAKMANLSQRTLSMLKVAATMSITAATGLMLWLATVTWNDDKVDEAIAAWRHAADSLGETFGAGDPMKLEALAAAWHGGAKDVADQKLRDFVTAGVQLADYAAGRAVGLQDAVKQLNRLHSYAFWTTMGELGVIAGLRLVAAVNPAARLASIKVGWRLSLALVLIQGAITARLEYLAGESLKKDSVGAGPAGVEETDFPRF
ncbi:hypothetical protein ACIBO2_36260 [Nonomuraea sp. NPDC050022]|uniref:hypothetical protein n=1 Tax=Nonomuraea sp. NPDC050022 TaxID=3364358 RepID=UPI00379B24BB